MYIRLNISKCWTVQTILCIVIYFVPFEKRGYVFFMNYLDLYHTSEWSRACHFRPEGGLWYLLKHNCSIHQIIHKNELTRKPQPILGSIYL